MTAVPPDDPGFDQQLSAALDALSHRPIAPEYDAARILRRTKTRRALLGTASALAAFAVVATGSVLVAHHGTGPSRLVSGAGSSASPASSPASARPSASSRASAPASFSPSSSPSLSASAAPTASAYLAVTVIPDVIGETQEAATAMLSDIGLRTVVVTAASSTFPGGTVLSQNPPPGSKVVSGATVTITVSFGPSPN